MKRWEIGQKEEGETEWKRMGKGEAGLRVGVGKCRRTDGSEMGERNRGKKKWNGDGTNGQG